MTEKRRLGSAGPRVFPVGLGCMPMSLEGRPDEAASARVILAALEAGVELLDTADAYCIDEGEMGHNERLVARALREWPERERVVVATKGGLRRPGGGYAHDGRPEYLAAACERSLRALGVERIDLYYLHAPDERVPFADSLGALARLREQGKIRLAGVSNVDAAQLTSALDTLPIACVQNRASPFHPQGLEDGVLALCEREELAFVAHSPVGGWQAGRIAHEPLLQELASALGATCHQVAIAWLLARSRSLIPIPGASRIRSAEGSAAAAGLRLPPEAVSRIDRHYGEPAS
ncbi:MAG: aldo/keto reductase [Deltaproteobacteria bacterium]|nr:aldo/keto reductase [Deltaproteobacteria bacterium]